MAAPSFKPDALPAVTVPSDRTMGLSFDKPSIVVSGRGCSSAANRTDSRFFAGIPFRRAPGAIPASRLAAIATLQVIGRREYQVWPFHDVVLTFDQRLRQIRQGHRLRAEKKVPHPRAARERRPLFSPWDS